MNTQITKPKNVVTADTVENRLAKLEKAMSIIAQLTDNNKQNNSAQGESIAQPNFLAQLEKLSTATIVGGQIAGNYLGINPNNGSGNSSGQNNKSSNNNILLSQGQIIAELAAAILKANQRNI